MLFRSVSQSRYNASEVVVKSGNCTVDLGLNNDVTVTNATASNLKAEVVGTGTFAVQATLAAETTKVIGTVNVAASQTIAVTQATAGNLNCTEASAAAIKTAVELIDNAISGTEMQVDVVPALPAGTNTIGSVGVNAPSTIGSGTKDVTTAGSRVALAASTACKKVYISAKETNTGKIYFGGSSVSATSGAFIYAGGMVVIVTGKQKIC